MTDEIQISGLPSTPGIQLTDQVANDNLSAVTYKFTIAQLVSFLAGFYTPTINVIAATTTALNATYNNGTAGVGATLTDASGTFSVFQTDGVSVALNQAVIVLFQANPAYNGIYNLTTNGDNVSTPWVLTRSVLFNKSSQMVPGQQITVYSGLTLAGSIYVLLSPQPVTIGSDHIEFFSMLQSVLYNQPADILLGNPTGSEGEVVPITLGTGLSFSGGALNASSAASTITIADDTTTNATMYPTWVTTNTGSLPLKVSSTKITFNPSTATLTTTTFSGALSGNATTATTATNVATTSVTTNATFYPLFVSSSSNSNQAPDLNTSLTYNPSTGTLSATVFNGSFSGTVTNATNIAIIDDTSTNATMYPVWVTANTGNLPAKVSSTKITFNPSTGILSTVGINLSGLTASYAVVTDGSKNLSSLQYTSSNTVSTLMSRDSSGNFSAGTATLSNVLLSNGGALQTTTSNTNTVLIQAYDVNDTVYRTFGTLTVGNTPSFALSQPSGGTLTWDGGTIGGTTPPTMSAAAPFRVAPTTSTAPFNSTSVYIQDNFSGYVGLGLETVNSSGNVGSVLVAGRGLGSYASKTLVTANTHLFELQVYGYDGSNYTQGAGLLFTSSNNATGGSVPTTATLSLFVNGGSLSPAQTWNNNLSSTFYGNIVMTNGFGITTPNSSGVSYTLSANKSSGVYVSFVNITSGSTPTCSITQPSGGTLSWSGGTIDSAPIGSTVASTGAFTTVSSDTTNAHTLLIQGYDVDDAVYRTFVTITNANVPTCAINAPSGSTGTIDGFNINTTGSGNGTFVALKATNSLALGNAVPIQTDTTAGHTYLFTAYDTANSVNRTFLTATAGTAPSAAFTVPTNGTLTFAGTTLSATGNLTVSSATSRFFFGTTTNNAGTIGWINILFDNTTNYASNYQGSVSGSFGIASFYNSAGSGQGTITCSGSGATTYATTSDYRLKENVVQLSNSVVRLKQLNPITFNMIGYNETYEGFLAHEAQAVVPTAVVGTKDAMKNPYTLMCLESINKDFVVDDKRFIYCTYNNQVLTYYMIGKNGQFNSTIANIANIQNKKDLLNSILNDALAKNLINPVVDIIDPQQMDNAKLVPLIIGAMQELIKRIEKLESK